MKVVEIFQSIDGEGIRAGLPVIFIRLYGCNLRCQYCDTKYSYNDEDYQEMSIFEILKEVQNYSIKRITLTGGEPLIHKDVDILIKLLRKNDYEVNIETNGSIEIAPYRLSNVIITMDYKCRCSGMEKEMYLPNIKKLRKQDVLKFVVEDEDDLIKVKEFSNQTEAQIFISPVFGKIQPVKIVDYILKNNLANCRVQLQLHKIIWDPNERGV